jgi:hypothetical protein
MPFRVEVSAARTMWWLASAFISSSSNHLGAQRIVDGGTYDARGDLVGSGEGGDTGSCGAPGGGMQGRVGGISKSCCGRKIGIM